MQTILLADEQVSAICRDLIKRLCSFGPEAPLVWCSVGNSGDKILRAILADDLNRSRLRRAIPDFDQKISFRRISFDRLSKVASFRDESDKPLPSSVLLIDGPIHSGVTMSMISSWLMSQGVKEIVSFGLAVKKSS